MTKFKSEWYGPELLAKNETRTLRLLDETAEEGARLAVMDRTWEVRRAEGLVSEVVTQPAATRRGVMSSRFGATKRRGFYGLFLERDSPWIRPAGDEAAAHLLARLRGL